MDTSGHCFPASSLAQPGLCQATAPVLAFRPGVLVESELCRLIAVSPWQPMVRGIRKEASAGFSLTKHCARRPRTNMVSCLLGRFTTFGN